MLILGFRGEGVDHSGVIGNAGSVDVALDMMGEEKEKRKEDEGNKVMMIM